MPRGEHRIAEAGFGCGGHPKIRVIGFGIEDVGLGKVVFDGPCSLLPSDIAIESPAEFDFANRAYSPGHKQPEARLAEPGPHAIGAASAASRECFGVLRLPSQ